MPGSPQQCISHRLGVDTCLQKEAQRTIMHPSGTHTHLKEHVLSCSLACETKTTFTLIKQKNHDNLTAFSTSFAKDPTDGKRESNGDEYLVPKKTSTRPIEYREMQTRSKTNLRLPYSTLTSAVLPKNGT
eukprot:2743505-Amphidinium_carterae.1